MKALALVVAKLANQSIHARIRIQPPAILYTKIIQVKNDKKRPGMPHLFN